MIINLVKGDDIIYFLSNGLDYRNVLTAPANATYPHVSEGVLLLMVEVFLQVKEGVKE